MVEGIGLEVPSSCDKWRSVFWECEVQLSAGEAGPSAH